tara:strand:+ start:404 stop:790 length:387 start_codon:yes stop_codon:yes gene_type:complete
MKESTIHLVYQREYYDDEDMDYFFINYTIFRNVPLSQIQRLNDKNFKQKVKEFCDKNFVETASNYNNYSEVNMIHGSEYYKTYADEFGKSGHYDDNTFYTDYGQKYNTREFFKHDFNEEVTKFMGGII